MSDYKNFGKRYERLQKMKQILKDIQYWNISETWQQKMFYIEKFPVAMIQFPTVIWQWLSHPMAVPMTPNDIEEYSLRSIAVLGCNMNSQITGGNVTLPEAVLSTVKIFAVYYMYILVLTI